MDGSAQITIDESDMPSPGDMVTKSNAINFNQYDFELTGEDYNWDFSELQPVSQTVDTFMKVTDTPLGYWPFFMLSSNLVSPLGDSPYEQLPLTDAFNFFNNSSNDFREVGFAATAYGIPLPFKFDTPDIIFDFPLTYGNAFDSHSGFEFAIPDFGYILMDRNRSSTVDGWGTLTTPYGTFDVLRIKSDVQEYDSVYLDSLSLGIPINLVYTEYKWLAKGQKLPLLKVTQNTLGEIVEYADTIRDISGIFENRKINNNEIVIYPNPVSNFIYVKLPQYEKGFTELNIYNFSGEKLVSINKKYNTGIFELDLRNLNMKPGEYILQYRTGEHQLTKTFIYSP